MAASLAACRRPLPATTASSAREVVSSGCGARVGGVMAMTFPDVRFPAVRMWWGAPPWRAPPHPDRREPHVRKRHGHHTPDPGAAPARDDLARGRRRRRRPLPATRRETRGHRLRRAARRLPRGLLRLPARPERRNEPAAVSY